MPTFTDQQKTELTQELQGEIAKAEKFVGVNRRYDIGFKIALLVLTIATTATSVLLASYETKPPKSLALSNALVAGLSTALASFAFTQFNFPKRQRGWQQRLDAFAGLKAELRYADPEREPFLERMAQIRGKDPDVGEEVRADRLIAEPNPPGPND
jgi:hypothetical protein